MTVTNVEEDYRGYDVSVEKLLRLLTGPRDAEVPLSKRLISDENSNILLYTLEFLTTSMIGHGDDQFLKYQYAEDIQNNDLIDAFGQMYEKKRHRELLVVDH